MIYINIENLYIGQVIKNYKELCIILEIEIKTGNSRIKQLKELSLYCSYSKQGNKYIIDDIYKTPIKEIAKNSIYVNLIGDILVNYLYENCKNKGYTVTLTIGKIMEIVGLVNNSYMIGNRHKKELSKVLDVNILSVYYFYSNIHGEFKKIIERSLNSLNNRRVLSYTKVKTIYTKDKKYIIASESQEQHILNIEKEVITDMGYNKIQDIFVRFKMREFQQRVKKKLPNDWIYYFDSYKLLIGDKAINLEYQFINDNKKALNEKSINRVNNKLKINDKMKDEIKLIDNLINIIEYDMNLSNNILLEYKNTLKERDKKISNKYIEIGNLVNDIEDIEAGAEEDINHIDYYAYIEDIKTVDSEEIKILGEIPF